MTKTKTVWAFAPLAALVTGGAAEFAPSRVPLIGDDAADPEIVELAMIAAIYAGTAMFTRAPHTPAEPNAGALQSAYGKC